MSARYVGRYNTPTARTNCGPSARGHVGNLIKMDLHNRRAPTGPRSCHLVIDQAARRARQDQSRRELRSASEASAN
jgi:hypothetical protein